MVIIAPLLYILFAYLVAVLGQDRKFGFWGYFFASIALSPIMGCLLVLASDPITPVQEGDKS